MRRFVTIALSLSLLLGLSAAGTLLAQDEAKKEAVKSDAPKEEPKAKPDEAKKEAAKPDEAKKDEAKPKDEAKKEAAKPAEPALPSIPPEVEAKLEAARRAVAEAIVAAQDAGLVQTSIDPPPILDILITGRATDATAIKGTTKDTPEAGVSPEVFGAWFTGFGKLEGVDYAKNVRIINPSKGLKEWYAARAAIMSRHIAEVRKAKGDAPKPEEKKEEAKPKDEPKKEEAKPKDEPKKEEPKAEEKKDAPKAEEKKDEAPKAQ